MLKTKNYTFAIKKITSKMLEQNIRGVHNITGIFDMIVHEITGRKCSRNNRQKKFTKKPHPRRKDQKQALPLMPEQIINVSFYSAKNRKGIWPRYPYPVTPHGANPQTLHRSQIVRKVFSVSPQKVILLSAFFRN